MASTEKRLSQVGLDAKEITSDMNDKGRHSYEVQQTLLINP